MSLWFISISASDWPERRFHMCELSETPCLRRDKRLQHSPSLPLASIPSLPSSDLHLGSEKVHIFIYKSWNSHIFHLANSFAFFCPSRFLLSVSIECFLCAIHACFSLEWLSCFSVCMNSVHAMHSWAAPPTLNITQPFHWALKISKIQ